MSVFIFLLAGVLSAAQPARLDVQRGLVHVMRAGTSNWGQVQEAAEIFQGDKIRTYADTQATVKLGDGSMIEVGSWSLLHVENTEGKDQSLRLDMGSIRAAVVKMMRRFRVATPVSVCSVRGTDFDVDVDPDQKGKTNVKVDDGQVAVADQYGKEVLLAKGDSVIVLMEGLQEPERSNDDESKNGRKKKIYSALGAVVFAAAIVLIL